MIFRLRGSPATGWDAHCNIPCDARSVSVSEPPLARGGVPTGVAASRSSDFSAATAAM